jgi:glutamyl-Q tRNA(Asp) synthetase
MPATAHRDTMPATAVACIGRFAPSPTGPLHFGSLVAAAASYLDARSQGGSWIVRMEDLDAGREQPGAADRILADLEFFGFEWDGPVWRQSERTEAYREALERLRAAGRAYPCGCSRKETAGAPYPGACARGLPEGKTARSWRVRVNGARIEFRDRLHGPQLQDLEAEAGDFVVFRADGQFAYHLAVVIDDAAQRVTDVVRGADLLDSTPRQIHLQRLLDLPEPRYLHVPTATDSRGAKLSKQTRAPALERGRAAALLQAALRFLGQQAAPPELERAPAKELLRWAIGVWSPERLPPVMSRTAAEVLDTPA